MFCFFLIGYVKIETDILNKEGNGTLEHRAPQATVQNLGKATAPSFGDNEESITEEADKIQDD